MAQQPKLFTVPVRITQTHLHSRGLVAVLNPPGNCPGSRVQMVHHHSHLVSVLETPPDTAARVRTPPLPAGQNKAAKEESQYDDDHDTQRDVSDKGFVGFHPLCNTNNMENKYSKIIILATNWPYTQLIVIIYNAELINQVT